MSELKTTYPIVPERELFTKYLPGAIPRNALEVTARKDGWNDCISEMERLNGRVVSLRTLQHAEDAVTVLRSILSGTPMTMGIESCDVLLEELRILLHP